MYLCNKGKVSQNKFLSGMDKMNIEISSEIGNLQGVLLHTPGHEVENMTPENARRSLYSDILNLSAATVEFLQLKGVLDKVSQTFEVKSLLTDILSDENVKEKLIRDICDQENANAEINTLLKTAPDTLACELIEGVVIQRDNLTRYLNKDRYSIQPLPNFLFTRDPSMVLWDDLLIGKMATKVREREPLIMEAIYREHPVFKVNPLNPARGTANLNRFKNATIEGGDLLIAGEDVILIGIGVRTSSEGVDFLIELIKQKKTHLKHIIVQELPHEPESFIHLDMTFTFLDKDSCIIYEPLILKKSKYQTYNISIDNGKVISIKEEKNLLKSLNKCGFSLSPVICGGQGDPWIMEREQWHSGANFLAIAPGKVIGYKRNDHTLEELNRNGFEIINAEDFIASKVNIDGYKKAAITIPGAELARGGGGARCLTMPLLREKIEW
jgi:arginine deiminase